MADGALHGGANPLLRADWPKGHVTTDPKCWDESPCLTKAAAEWLVAKRPKVLGYDLAQEEKGGDYPDPPLKSRHATAPHAQSFAPARVCVSSVDGNDLGSDSAG